MVFEKIKNFFSGEEEKEGEVEEEEEGKESLTVQQTLERLEDKKSDPLEQMEKDVQPLLGEITTLQEKIKNLKTDFETAEPEEDVHPNLYKSSKEAKRLLLSKMDRAIEKINVPDDVKWDPLLDFNRALQDAVNLLKNAKVSHGGQVSALFEQEMRNFTKLTNDLQSLSKDLNTSLRKTKLKIDEFDELSDKITKRKELLEQQEELKEELEDLKEQRREVKDELERERESLESLKKSERFEELREINERIENLSQKKEKTLKKIDSKISDLARPLRKMSKMIERDEHMVGKDVLDALDYYLEDPGETAVYEAEEDLSKLKKLFEELETVLEDKMELGDRERRKRLEEVRNILNNRKIKELRDKFFEIEEKIKNLGEERETSSLLEKKENLEESIQDKESELEKINDRIENLEGEIEELDNQTNELAVEIREEAKSILGVWVENL